MLSMVFIGGCAKAPMVFQPGDSVEADLLWEQRQSQLQQVESWAVKGRLAVQTEHDGWSASLQWAQQKQLYKMRIIAPLGQGTYELQGGHGKVSLLTSKNELLEANDPYTLMQTNLGWSVPVLGLRYWIRGLPDPHAGIDNLILNMEGHVTDLSQDGWQIQFSRYEKVGDLDLPGKISMESDRIKLRLIIKDWVKVI